MPPVSLRDFGCERLPPLELKIDPKSSWTGVVDSIATGGSPMGTHTVDGGDIGRGLGKPSGTGVHINKNATTASVLLPINDAAGTCCNFRSFG